MAPLTGIKTRSEIESIIHYKSTRLTGNRTNDTIYLDYDGQYIEFTANIWNHGLVQLFIELLSNSIDNFTRQTNSEYYDKQTFISVEIEDDILTISNDGIVIPIIGNGEDITTAFGSLRSSGNYVENSNTIGQYGLGSKVVNIYSSEYTVSIYDTYNQKSFVQTWTNHMESVSKPIIKSYKKNQSKTVISYKVDFNLFYSDSIDSLNRESSLVKLTNYNEGDIRIIELHCLNAAVTTGLIVKFSHGDIHETYRNLSFSKYINFFNYKNYVRFTNDNSDLFIVESLGERRAISFVNGVFVLQGKHIDYWYTQIYNIFKLKFPSIKRADFDKNFILILNYRCTNPEFLEEYKQTFLKPVPKNLAIKGLTIDKNFSIKNPTEKEEELKRFLSIIKKISKWSFLQDIKVDTNEDKISAIEQEIVEKSKHVIIERHEQIMGWPKVQGTLNICEGDSAASLVRWGIVNDGGRKKHGIFTGKGKVLNVSKANDDKVHKNKIISELKLVLNVFNNLDYTKPQNRAKLAYKNILFSFDADSDGSHILGLYITFLSIINPSLLLIKDFLQINCTPLISVKTKGSKLWFYSNNEFNEYSKNRSISGEIVRYKGLGTFEKPDAIDIFGKKIMSIYSTKSSNNSIQLMFSSKPTIYSVQICDDLCSKDITKDHYKDNNNVSKDTCNIKDNPECFRTLTNRKDVANYYLDIIHNKKDINYNEYSVSIDDIMFILVGEFQYEDNIRSIPSIIDGFKESQRKILYTILGIKNKIKVADLAARLTSVAKYHHGESAAAETIIKMAQTFTGSNNIALLCPKGNFGSINLGGKDAASPRYIYTQLNDISNYIFRKEDKIILKPNISEDEEVEPYYLPIIPMVLVNGSVGIGFGYSCNIPSYNPYDLIEYIFSWLDKNNSNNKDISLDNNKSNNNSIEFIPWYTGFEGHIYIDDDRIICQGRFDSKTNTIKELPVGTWYKPYENFLKELSGLSKKSSKEKTKEKTKEKDTKKDTKKIISGYTAKMLQNDIVEFTLKSTIDINLLKLTKIIPSHLVMFDTNHVLKQYDSVYEILDEWCLFRLNKYEERKIKYTQQLEEEYKQYSDIVNFISNVVDGSFDLSGKTRDNYIDYFKLNNYLESSYSKILDIKTSQYTIQKVNKYKQTMSQLSSNISHYKQTTSDQLWKEELESLLEACDKYYESIE